MFRPQLYVSVPCPLNSFLAVLEAIYTRNPAAVKAAIIKIHDKPLVIRALRNASFRGRTPIMHAARRGDLDTFNVVFEAMQTNLTREQVQAMLSCVLTAVSGT